MHSILIDNNLSFKLEYTIQEVADRVTHVANVGLDKSGDLEIWEHAKRQGMAILTKDSDFRKISNIYGCPPKVIHLNCGNRSTAYILNLIKVNKGMILSFIQNKHDCYLELN